MSSIQTLSAQQVQNDLALKKIQALLQQSKLPYQDIVLEGNIMMGYFENHQLVGCGGLELYGPYALLRSVAVDANQRGKQFGQHIVDDLLNRAQAQGIQSVYLLTETAHAFFLKKSFVDVDRMQVPTEVKASTEFTSVCPVSAACMVRVL